MSFNRSRDNKLMALMDLAGYEYEDEDSFEETDPYNSAEDPDPPPDQPPPDPLAPPPDGDEDWFEETDPVILPPQPWTLPPAPPPDGDEDSFEETDPPPAPLSIQAQIERGRKRKLMDQLDSGTFGDMPRFSGNIPPDIQEFLRDFVPGNLGELTPEDLAYLPETATAQLQAEMQRYAAAGSPVNWRDSWLRGDLGGTKSAGGNYTFDFARSQLDKSRQQARGLGFGTFGDAVKRGTEQPWWRKIMQPGGY